MSIYNDVSFMLPVQDSQKPSQEELRQLLRKPEALQAPLKVMGFSHTSQISLSQLRELFQQLGQQAVFDEILPVLEDVKDSKDMVNILALEDILKVTADLNVFYCLCQHVVARPDHA